MSEVKKEDKLAAIQLQLQEQEEKIQEVQSELRQKDEEIKTIRKRFEIKDLGHVEETSANVVVRVHCVSGAGQTAGERE